METFTFNTLATQNIYQRKNIESSISKNLRFFQQNAMLICIYCGIDFEGRFILHLSLQEKNGEPKKSVFNIDTTKTQHLPVLDFAPFDIGDDNEEFGLLLGPVCFS